MKAALALAFFLAACDTKQTCVTYDALPVWSLAKEDAAVIRRPSPTPAPAARPLPIIPPSAFSVLQKIRWDTAQIRPEKRHFVTGISNQVARGRARYEAVSKATGVPWQIIGAIHNMEASLSFRLNLAQGDPLTAFSRHVPAGRPKVGHGPPFTWEEAAVDALRFDRMSDRPWGDIGHSLQNVEIYNGTGYQRFHPTVPTPYLWSWTTLYTRGKYVADGKWSDTAVSEQCGAVPILKSSAIPFSK